MAPFSAALLLFLGVPTVLSISLADHVTTSNRNLFPASRLVDLKLYNAQDSERLNFERTHLPITDNASFSSLLRRRDGLSIYGKDIVHGSEEPNYATLSLLPIAGDSVDDSSAGSSCGFEATLLLTPDDNVETDISLGGSCFVAMNRFAVKEGFQDLFEQRWAERQSKLPAQPGFLAFCLIRQRNNNDKNRHLDEILPSFNYSSLTLWKSFDAWTGWRNGDGRYSHDASRAAKRTPVSEWLEHPASPIFWDGIGTVMTEIGV